MMETMERLKELENATCDIIQIIKQIPELAGTRLAVAGGLALWHYLPDHRPTNNIDFITNLWSFEVFETKLLNHLNSPFRRNEQALVYYSPSGRGIEIKITSEISIPELWDAMQVVQEIPYGEIPYVSRKDLLLMKRRSTERKNSNPAKRRQDATDAEALADDDKPMIHRFASVGTPTSTSDENNEVVAAEPGPPTGANTVTVAGSPFLKQKGGVNAIVTIRNNAFPNDTKPTIRSPVFAGAPMLKTWTRRVCGTLFKDRDEDEQEDIDRSRKRRLR